MDFVARLALAGLFALACNHETPYSLGVDDFVPPPPGPGPCERTKVMTCEDIPSCEWHSCGPTEPFSERGCPRLPCRADGDCRSGEYCYFATRDGGCAPGEFTCLQVDEEELGRYCDCEYSGCSTEFGYCLPTWSDAGAGISDGGG